MKTIGLVACWLISFGVAVADELRTQLDAPLLYVKRQSYFSGHIYDDYYTWHPGGGIYVIENPWDPPERQKERAVIDPTTPETLGVGVYRDPELSYDATRIIFAFKGEEEGPTSIYEIGIDGRGLRRLTNPEKACTKPAPVRVIGLGRHDISPCYLPDGRIVFSSTREAGRVPCFNSEVDTLHVMNADGSDVHPISVNNVNEFDPVVLPDGRLLFGRWEYVDKTALYMQSLWTMNPDGTDETAFFGNNLAKPTAFLDARPVPNSHLIVASLTPHNGQAVGAIAMIDAQLGKNNLKALHNFTPEYPTEMDQGLRKGPCDPWPISEDLVLISNNGTNREYAVLELIDRSGRREVIHAETNISCYSAMLVKPRPVPPNSGHTIDSSQPARFLIQDVSNGLEGVRRGEIKKLRVIEETSRVSGIPPGGRWWNQAFLVSWQGSYSVKNFLGTVPVEEDGSAYFEAPPGRALYFQALDGDGRAIQSMRTFVKAVPGVTRSCVGCHEYKFGAPTESGAIPVAQTKPASHLAGESWGSGFIDYPTMIQPIWDKHCISCHGGEKGIAAGIDLTGGWTWAFNISYETLIKDTKVGFLNCVNEAVKTADILPPRTHGSSAAPLAKLLLDGHDGRIPGLTRTERELVFEWMDGNCNYYGTWDWTETGTCQPIISAGQRLSAIMRSAGCLGCHSEKIGNDWINLQQPELSRILRAPLDTNREKLGLSWCRDRKAVDVFPLVTSPAQPPDVFSGRQGLPIERAGEPRVTFSSTADPNYQAMLTVIRTAREEVLSRPRVDQPGADIIAGMIRQLVPTPLPSPLPQLQAHVADDGVVELSWTRSSKTIGLTFELHRGDSPTFVPGEKTLLIETALFHFSDVTVPTGLQHYALVLVSDGKKSNPVRVAITVANPARPSAVRHLQTRAKQGEVVLTWEAQSGTERFNVYRADAASQSFDKINHAPVRSRFYLDEQIEPNHAYEYRVCSLSRRDQESDPSPVVSVISLPERVEPILEIPFGTNALAKLDNALATVRVNGKATIRDGALSLGDWSNATLPPHAALDLRSHFSIECRVKMADMRQSPVLLSYGRWKENGWFLQKFGKGWRWHLGGVDCDGGEAKVGEWTHLFATFDGDRANLFQDGALVASVSAVPDRTPWTRHLYIGQYGAAPGPEFQMLGQIAGIKIYHRAIKAEEAARLSNF